jgi:hypothetical protein
MSFSDSPFAYGPFVPHHIPRQYIENYFSSHNLDSTLLLNTTVEDVSQIPTVSKDSPRWKLTLRRYDVARQVDVWWSAEFDFVVFANGHYSVPYVRNPSYSVQQKTLNKLQRCHRSTASINICNCSLGESYIQNTTARP